jgi:hypothetical protein
MARRLPVMHPLWLNDLEALEVIVENEEVVAARGGGLPRPQTSPPLAPGYNRVPRGRLAQLVRAPL